MFRFSFLLLLLGLNVATFVGAADSREAVDANSLRGKILTGYQGWFRTPGDAQNKGWVHWSHDGNKITPQTLTFEMWPDMSEFSAEERSAAPGFTTKDGAQAYLFSSDHAGTVKRHFEWMRDYGIDGVWLQHFVVDLPGAPAQARYESRSRVLNHVRKAASETGRVWALTFDMAGMKSDQIFDIITREWKNLVDEGVVKDDRYVRQDGNPVVQLWGFYQNVPSNDMTAEVANQLIDFFKTSGPYQAYLVGGGDWKWRTNSDPEWHRMFRRFDGYSPWNPGNLSRSQNGDYHATTNYWAEDKAECDRLNMLWLPTIYPGFSWDNLRKLSPGTSTIPRRRGRFLWEQFHALSKVGAEGATVAMFDEVDEATAIFKVTNEPPVQAHFLTYEGLPSDWYLRLVGEASKRLQLKQAIPAEIPLQP